MFLLIQSDKRTKSDKEVDFGRATGFRSRLIAVPFKLFCPRGCPAGRVKQKLLERRDAEDRSTRDEKNKYTMAASGL